MDKSADDEEEDILIPIHWSFIFGSRKVDLDGAKDFVEDCTMEYARQIGSMGGNNSCSIS